MHLSYVRRAARSGLISDLIKQGSVHFGELHGVDNDNPDLQHDLPN